MSNFDFVETSTNKTLPMMNVPLFRGRFYRTIDFKGRVMLPVDFRDILLAQQRPDSGSGRVILLTAFDACVVGYPLGIWENAKANFQHLTAGRPDRQLRDIRRFFTFGAKEAAFDNHNRLLIPRGMRIYARLIRFIVIIGIGKGFEIWDKHRFEARHRAAEKISNTAIDALFDWEQRRV